MHEFIAWCGFVGAWLLFAGPIYQAAIELEEENLDGDAIAATRDSVPEPRRISPWWWLLPPVGYILSRRALQRYRDAVLAALAPEHLERFIRFHNKATGWIFVAAGAGFIAIKETYELAEVYEWPIGVLIVLVLVMLFLAATNTVLRVRNSHRMLGEPTGRDRGR